MILFLLSALQIIIESLPISSSGHVYLLKQYLDAADFTTVIYTLAHVPTFIIFMLLFKRHVLFFLRLFTRYRYTILVILGHMFCRVSFAYTLSLKERGLRRLGNLVIRVLVLLLCAEIPTLILYYYIKKRALITIPLWLGFVGTALLLGSLKVRSYGAHLIPNSMSSFFPVRYSIRPQHALILGVAQGCALLPGISRLASTYVVGRWLGFSWRTSFSFSCLMQMPLVAAALIGECYSARVELVTLLLSVEGFLLGLVMVLSGIIAYELLRMVMIGMQTERLWYFGMYMVVPIMLALLLKRA